MAETLKTEYVWGKQDFTNGSLSHMNKPESAAGAGGETAIDAHIENEVDHS